MGRRVLVGKLGRTVVTLLIVSVFTFSIVNLLPGDPAAAVLGPDANAEQLDAFRAENDLDAPIPARYVSWLGDVVRGDLGTSLRSHQGVLDAIRERAPVSFELMLLTQIFALAVAIPAGMYAAYREGGRFDRSTTLATFGLIAIPNFMMALILIYLFALQFNVLPATGFTPFFEDPLENLRRMVLPVVTLASAEIAVYQRLLRSDMVTTLKADFLTMARAKGLPTRTLLLRHTLRLSSFSIITLVGINIGRLLGGAVIVETLFALPGVGRLLIQSIIARDLIMVQGVVLFTAVVYVVANTIVDLLYGALDPRSTVDQ